ncbi:MAG: TIGR03086 family metal-binding protein [Actinomycetota bacterium]
MDDVAARFRRVAEGFSQRTRAVDDAGWERPAPPEGWTARDVVVHLTTWVPDFLAAAGAPPLPTRPDPARDPAGAWEALRAAVQALLDDPVSATTPIEHPVAGAHALGEAIGTFVLGDVLVHTWDLARATAQDERLDPEEVHAMLVGMEPLDEALRASGHYGPRVETAADADEQTRLIAFTGRHP